ncbi:MAG TPA: ABC transporter substrate-binding protein, partial [Acidimicrobiales bacterium]|nr:ABC transporter substrate-binding protein [Acidimicrobiales bacterium]
MGVLRAGVRHRWLPLLAVVALLTATGALAASPPASAASAASRVLAASAPATNGQWPGVGKICEPGPGGTSSVRGVGQNTIHIAVFNDQSNTVLPGLEKEFLQFAAAFAAWCNASGGINGRHIVIDNRDAALFNSAQVTNEACQSDFMAVGGGVVFDGPTVPVRVACGLGQITGYTPSDAGSSAPLQVNPNGTNPKYVPAGWFAALARQYPQAVKKASLGAQNNPNVLEPEHKFADAAQALGWNVLSFQTVPLSVADWTPYIQDLQTDGIEAVWPSADGTVTSYMQA